MNKIKITPIGTCRVNTPLKRGATRYPIKLDYRRTYGFVHTSEEVLQQMRYRRGELVVPDEIKPLLFRPGYDREHETPSTEPSDLTIVEISSSKSCLIGDIAVQTNYVIRHFNDLLSAPNRSKLFWDLVAKGSRHDLKSFLALPHIAHFCSSDERELLSRLTFHRQTYDEVHADMATISELVGASNLLFVTHVNAKAADGEVIPNRDRLIRWVKMASENLGVRCFDPTELMLEMGQERAMEREGLDLTHFTNAFYDRWYAQVQRDYIVPSAGDSSFGGEDASDSGAAFATESISTAIEVDDFFDGTHQLYAALKTYPDYVPLQLLHGQVLARLGDYDGASGIFSRHADAAEMTAETRQSFMRVLLETGDFAGALSVARQLLTDEYENDEIFQAAGTASQHLGLTNEAIRFRKLAFRFNPAATSSALLVLDHFREARDQAQYDTWLQEVLEMIESGKSPAAARALAEWALRQGEAEVFANAFAALTWSDRASLPRLVDEATEAGMTNALAAAAARFGDLSDLPDRVERSLRKLGKKWAQEAVDLLSEDRFADAARMVSACLVILPHYRVAIQVQRELLSVLRNRITACTGDPGKVIQICDSVGDFVFGLRGTAMLYAKALMQAKQWHKARLAFNRLHDAEPDDINIKANLAFVSASDGDFIRALQLYHALSTSDPDLVGRYRPRVERFMATAETSALRHLRHLAGEGQFHQAIELAGVLQQLGLLEDRLPAELERIRKMIRAHLRQRGEDEMGAAEALSLLKIMLSIAPDEGPVLRRAALEAMRLGDFVQALGYWERLDGLVPDQPSTIANINRCQIFIKRMARLRRPAARLAA